MLQEGSELGGYRIERELGRGGMGVVYEATQVRLERAVALKVLSPALGHEPQFKERFRREGLAQAAVDHPHIVTVYEAGEANSWLFLAMRLVHGPTLKELIRSGELTLERAMPLLRQVADGLDAAHRAGLVHRDVKPQNILVGAGDHAYLADFGLTRILAETGLTESGQYMGTPHYMAPEQVSGEQASSASDVYALAAVAYECLTGSVPFERDSNQAVLFAHVYEEPPRASERRPGIPAAVDDVVARGMAKEPAERPGSAGALVAELAGALRGEALAPTAAAAAPRFKLDPSLAAQLAKGRVPKRWLVRPPVAASVALALVACAVAAVLLIGGGDDAGSEDGGSPAGGAAKAVTLGSALDNPDQPRWTCFGEPKPTAPCTLAQTALLDRPLRARFDGVVTRWRVTGAKGPMKLVILRGRVARDGRSRLARVAASAQVRVPDTKRHGFRTGLPVKQGDRIGLQLSFGAHVAAPWVGEGARIERWDPILTGQAKRADPPQDGYELLYNADVEGEGGD